MTVNIYRYNVICMFSGLLFLARLYESTGRAMVVTTVSVLSVRVTQNVKVFG